MPTIIQRIGLGIRRIDDFNTMAVVRCSQPAIRTMTVFSRIRFVARIVTMIISGNTVPRKIKNSTTLPAASHVVS